MSEALEVVCWLGRGSDADRECLHAPEPRAPHGVMASARERPNGGVRAGPAGPVSFNQDVRSCAYLATSGRAGTGLQGPGAMLHVSQRELDPNGVRVRTYDENANPVIRSFHLAVFC